MKIGIITLYGEFNYGNRLQNYALQRTLELLGYKAVTLVVDSKTNIMKKYLKKFLHKKNDQIKLIPRNEKKRERNIKTFTNRYINTEFYKTNDGKMPIKVNEFFDCFVVGSDQVWNPLFWGDERFDAEAYNYFLSFAEPQKRISYAASFGISELPEKYQKNFKHLLEGFNHISVRESDGADIVNSITTKLANIVLDPTMLLEVDEWRKVSSQGIKPKFRYIVTYFLGDQENEFLLYINELSLKYGYEIINIMDEKCVEYYTGGPDTFLSLIDNAEICFSDSFHATVFSILFHTPFVVVDRKHSNNSNMNSRINTLLSKFDMIDRSDWRRIEDPFKCSFEKANLILELEKKQSLIFLKDSLNNVF